MFVPAFRFCKNTFCRHDNKQGSYCGGILFIVIMGEKRSENTSRMRHAPIVQFIPLWYISIEWGILIVLTASFSCRAKSLFALQQAQRGERNGCFNRE